MLSMVEEIILRETQIKLALEHLRIVSKQLLIKPMRDQIDASIEVDRAIGILEGKAK